MTQNTKDVLEKYQVRKSKKQKTEFIDFVTERARAMGYTVNIEKGSLGARNIVIGDPDTAKVVYTAHYDTCARLPFPNFLTPKNIFIYILYNIAVVFGFFAVAFVIGFAFGVISALSGLPAEIGSYAARIMYLVLLVLLFAGPANKTTVNDNTSGVTLLFEAMEKMPNALKSKAAFVFFDLEESGLIGSGSFAKKHKSVRDNTPLVNFDCVSDGENMLIVAKGKAYEYAEVLKSVFESNESVKAEVANKAFYPSDQAKFKKGIGVAFFLKTKGGMLYMNKIHTSKDKVYREENIIYLTDGVIKLTERI